MHALAFQHNNQNYQHKKFKPIPTDLLSTKDLSKPELISLIYILSNLSKETYVSIDYLSGEDGHKQPWYKRSQTRKHIRYFIDKDILRPITTNGHNKIIGFKVNIKHPIFESKKITHFPANLVNKDPKANYHAVIRHLESNFCRRSRSLNKTIEDQPFQTTISRKYGLDKRTVRKRDAILFKAQHLERKVFSKYKKAGHIYDIPHNLQNKRFSVAKFCRYFSINENPLDGFCTYSYKLNKFNFNYTENRLVRNNLKQERLWKNLIFTSRISKEALNAIKVDCDNRNLVFYSYRALRTYVQTVMPRFTKPKLKLRDLVKDEAFLNSVAEGKDILNPYPLGYIQYALKKLRWFYVKGFNTYEEALNWCISLIKRDTNDVCSGFIQKKFSNKLNEFEQVIITSDKDVTGCELNDWGNNEEIVQELISSTGQPDCFIRHHISEILKDKPDANYYNLSAFIAFFVKELNLIQDIVSIITKKYSENRIEKTANVGKTNHNQSILPVFNYEERCASFTKYTKHNIHTENMKDLPVMDSDALKNLDVKSMLKPYVKKETNHQNLPLMCDPNFKFSPTDLEIRRSS